MSPRLAMAIINAASTKKSVILDPMAGSGTVVASATYSSVGQSDLTSILLLA